VAQVTVRIGQDVVQHVEADDFAVWPGQLRFYRRYNQDMDEFVTAFDLSEVTGMTIVGDWQGHTQAALPTKIPIQFVK
jgi:hypothetical protein